MALDSWGSAMLFEALPEFPVSLPDDELSLLARLNGCDWPTNQEIDWRDYPAARRLEKRGLIKIARQKDDPVAHYPTWYAGRTGSSQIRPAIEQEPQS